MEKKMFVCFCNSPVSLYITALFVRLTGKYVQTFNKISNFIIIQNGYLNWFSKVIRWLTRVCFYDFIILKYSYSNSEYYTYANIYICIS